MPDAIPAEIWRPIPGFRGEYEASSLGRIRSRKGNRKSRILSTTLRGGGPHGAQKYLAVITSLGGKCASQSVHRLVAMAFHGEPPYPGAHVCHADGDPKNNTPGNLRWGTAKDNAADMRRHNRHRNGRKTHCKRGHEFTPSNTIWKPITRTPEKLGRTCRACKQAYEREYYSARRR